jgi:hypothetical protein
MFHNLLLLLFYSLFTAASLPALPVLATTGFTILLVAAAGSTFWGV